MAPESGRIICPPSSRSMYQRVSLYWQLSVMSPVTMVKPSGVLVRGPLVIPRMALTMACVRCVDRNSCGRYAESNG
ncbi:hypothetical protein [Actinoplanes palleronii]|nr:hypothetical protein [Actinoplanes palleronii]